jgi:hypothetical protein
MKIKNLIPGNDEVAVVIFQNETSRLIQFNIIKKSDSKQYEDSLIEKFGGEDEFKNNYTSFAMEQEEMDMIIKAGLIPFMKIMAEASGHEESAEDKANYEYYYGKTNTEIN